MAKGAILVVGVEIRTLERISDNGEIHPKPSSKTLATYISNPHSIDRHSVVEALGKVRGKEYVDGLVINQLCKLAEEGDREICLDAVYTLGSSGR